MAVGGKQRGKGPAGPSIPHREHNAPGGPKNPFGARPDKAALLERMRQAARKGQDEGREDGPEPHVRTEGEA